MTKTAFDYLLVNELDLIFKSHILMMYVVFNNLYTVKLHGICVRYEVKWRNNIFYNVIRLWCFENMSFKLDFPNIKHGYHNNFKHPCLYIFFINNDTQFYNENHYLNTNVLILYELSNIEIVQRQNRFISTIWYSAQLSFIKAMFSNMKE